jgi:hypothetical protein
MISRFDTQTDFLPTGQCRCEFRYKDIDGCGDSHWARCTRPAVLRVQITPAKTTISMDEPPKVTYVAPPNEAFQAITCEKCYEHAVHLSCPEGPFVNVEALLRPSGGAVISQREAVEVIKEKIAKAKKDPARISEIYAEYGDDLVNQAFCAEDAFVRAHHEGFQSQEYLGGVDGESVAALFKNLITTGIELECAASAKRVPLTYMSVLANFDAAGDFVSLELEPLM